MSHASATSTSDTLCLLAENASDVISTHDLDGSYKFVSPSCRVLAGYEPEELVGHDAYELIHPDDVPVVQRAHAQVLQSPDIATVAFRLRRKDGRFVWMETTSRTVRDPRTGEVVELICVTRDITDRKQVEEDLRREQQLLRRLLDVHERERKLIAYDIHDGLVQLMTGALMHLEAGQAVLEQDAARAQTELQRSTLLLRNAVDEARRMISGLRPPVLDESGLVAAVEYLANETRRAGLEVDVHHELHFHRLPAALESAVFRIVQEALTNVRRHSRSARASIELVQSQDQLCIEVRDWGVGFDPRAVRADANGLMGIRQRARLLGGSSTIETAPGAGTRVLVTCPLSATGWTGAVVVA